MAASEWAKILSPAGSLSIRETPYDSVVVGLLLDQNTQKHIIGSGFDGFYTYFAAERFTYGSTRSN